MALKHERGSAARRCRATCRAVCVTLATAGLAACYKTVPLTTPVPSGGTRVMISLTTEGTRDLAGVIGPNVVRVEGIVAAADTARVDVQLLNTWQANGAETSWSRERVSFPRRAIAQLSERQLDRTRSYLAAAAVTAGVVLIGTIFKVGGIGDGDDGAPPPPPQWRR